MVINEESHFNGGYFKVSLNRQKVMQVANSFPVGRNDLPRIVSILGTNL
jgi:hypothetical protein